METKTKKRWLVVLPNHQREWIKEVALEAEVKGSDIISELIEEKMSGNPTKFKAGLVNAKLKIKLQALNDRETEILEEKREIKRQMGVTEREKVTV